MHRRYFQMAITNGDYKTQANVGLIHQVFYKEKGLSTYGPETSNL
jgi:hypothetical protein